ncbi:uncharacterized protein LOC103702293 [Phoenix dactylifera]|uniref:Uncharacterized protein LOC103702293 n=1 Tax=Phoenix dactylifera TaxID=42345 RepID=A0A8B7BPZ0_PHODC|nr:uncharacterized protein LOC103702293 [Phoenix dactylifera]
MAHQPHPSSMRSVHDFTVKPPCPSSTSRKIKALLHAYVFRYVRHVVQAITSAKSMVMELLSKKSTMAANHTIKLRRKRNKKLLSSIRLHFNWSSSHVIPVPEPTSMEDFDMSRMYYDSTWNSIISTEEGEEDMEPPLSGYLRWLEEKNSEASAGDDCGSEIDRLAEKFIASCHEKFRLEKQESYRRYQEMLARSM